MADPSEPELAICVQGEATTASLWVGPGGPHVEIVRRRKDGLVQRCFTLPLDQAQDIARTLTALCAKTAQMALTSDGLHALAVWLDKPCVGSFLSPPPKDHA